MIHDWRKIPCPVCGRKGLHFANHPHAYGYKDMNRIACRFCQKRFNREKLEVSLEARKVPEQAKGVAE